MTIWTKRLDRNVLEKEVPEGELLLFIKLAHFQNESLALMKAVLWSCQPSNCTPAIGNGQTSLVFMWLRLLAGCLYEAFQLLQSAFYRAKLWEAYRSVLSEQAQEALKDVNQYFSSRKDTKLNTMKAIRNYYAFHYSNNIDAALKSALGEAEDEELLVYTEDAGSASKQYYFAEVLVNRAMFGEYGESLGDSVASLQKEILQVAGWLRTACDGLLTAFATKYPKAVGPAQGADALKPRPSCGAVHIPWFVSLR